MKEFAASSSVGEAGADSGFEKFGALFSGERMAEVEALRLAAALVKEEIVLFAGFDPFGDDALMESLAHVDDGAGHGGSVGVSGNLVNEGTIDFEGVDGKPSHGADTGIAGAEVVHSELHTQIFESAESGDGGLDVIQEDAF